MKFDNKLTLSEYAAITESIANAYFDRETGEYIPHLGELFTLATYFNNCVTLDPSETTAMFGDTDNDGSEEVVAMITDINDIVKLTSNEEFMDGYMDAIKAEPRIDIDFANAYRNAHDIIEQRKNGMYQFTTNTLLGLKTVGEILEKTISSINMDQLSQISKNIADGKLSADEIVQAYQQSDRYKEVISESNDDSIIQITK